MSLNRGKIKVQSTAKKLAKPKDVIYSPEGQWKYPGQITRIPSNNITMRGVSYPVLGVDDQGNEQMMYPGMEYQFPGNYVTEYPQMAQGGPSSDKAREMLHDGTANGQPLTAKQKRYFGMLAYRQDGGGDKTEEYIELQKRLEEEKQRASGIRSKVIPTAKRYFEKNKWKTVLPETTSEGQSYYCNTRTGECYQTAGATIPPGFEPVTPQKGGKSYIPGSPLPVIPGTQQWAGLAPNMGFERVSYGKQQPGDIVQFISDKNLPYHSLIYAGKNPKGEHTYYNDRGAGREYRLETKTHPLKQSNIWRYTGAVPKMQEKLGQLRKEIFGQYLPIHIQEINTTPGQTPELNYESYKQPGGSTSTQKPDPRQIQYMMKVAAEEEKVKAQNAKKYNIPTELGKTGVYDEPSKEEQLKQNVKQLKEQKLQHPDTVSTTEGPGSGIGTVFDIVTQPATALQNYIKYGYLPKNFTEGPMNFFDIPAGELTGGFALKGIKTAAKVASPYVRDIPHYLPSIKKGKIQFPEYHPVVRVEPQGFVKGSGYNPSLTPEQNALRGNWGETDLSMVDEYITGVQSKSSGPKQVLVKRLPKTLISKTQGLNLPIPAKTMSFGKGEFKSYKDIANKGWLSTAEGKFMDTLEKNPHLLSDSHYKNQYDNIVKKLAENPELYQKTETILPTHYVDAMRKKPSLTSDNPYKIKEHIENIYQKNYGNTLFGIPRRYSPFETGGSLEEEIYQPDYNTGEEEAMAKSINYLKRGGAPCFECGGLHKAENGASSQNFSTGNELEQTQNQFLQWLRGTSMNAVESEMDNDTDFHMMPDGSLMSNSEMEEEYKKGGKKAYGGDISIADLRDRMFQGGGGFFDISNYSSADIEHDLYAMSFLPVKEQKKKLADGTIDNYLNELKRRKTEAAIIKYDQDASVKAKYSPQMTQEHDGGAQNGLSQGWGFKNGGLRKYQDTGEVVDPWVQYFQGRGYGSTQGEVDLNTVPQYTPTGSDFTVTPQNKIYLQGQTFPTDSIVDMPNAPGVGIAYVNGKPVIVPTDKTKKKEVDAWKAKHMKVAQKKKGHIMPFYFQEGGMYDEMQREDSGNIPRNDYNDMIYQEAMGENDATYQNQTVDDILQDRIKALGFEGAMEEYNQFILGEEPVEEEEQYQTAEDEEAVDLEEENYVATDEEQADTEEEAFFKKGGNWIQDAVNPAHKGYCTPMTKSTCTPRRKAFARTMKKHHGFQKQDGGYPELNPNNNLEMFTQAYDQSLQENNMGNAWNAFLQQGIQAEMNSPYNQPVPTNTTSEEATTRAQHGGSPSASKYDWRSWDFNFPMNKRTNYSADNPEDFQDLPAGSQVTGVTPGYGFRGKNTKQGPLGKFFGVGPKKLTVTIRMPNGQVVEVPKGDDSFKPTTEPLRNPGMVMQDYLPQGQDGIFNPSTDPLLNPGMVMQDEDSPQGSYPYTEEDIQKQEEDAQANLDKMTQDMITDPLNKDLLAQDINAVQPRSPYTEKKASFTKKTKYNPEDVVNWSLAGMDMLTSTINQKDVRKREKELRSRTMAENLYSPVPRSSRGDYSVNEGYFRPDQMVPTQFQGASGVYGKYGGQNNFREGGEYYLTDAEIRRIQEAGGEVDFIED